MECFEMNWEIWDLIGGEVLTRLTGGTAAEFLSESTV